MAAQTGASRAVQEVVFKQPTSKVKISPLLLFYLFLKKLRFILQVYSFFQSFANTPLCFSGHLACLYIIKKLFCKVKLLL